MGVLDKLKELGEELKESTGYSPTTRPQKAKAADEAAEVDDDLGFEEEEVPELEGEPLSGDEAPEATTVTPPSLNRGGFEPVPGPRSDERLEVALAEAEQAKQALADAEQAKAEAEAEATQAKQAQGASKAKARDLEFQLEDAKAEAEDLKQQLEAAQAEAEQAKQAQAEAEKAKAEAEKVQAEAEKAQADAEVESEDLGQRVKELERQVEALEARGARPIALRDTDGKIDGLTDREIVNLIASPHFIGELDAHARGRDFAISPEMATVAKFLDIIIEEQNARDRAKAEAEAQREADAARAQQLFKELNELLKKSGCSLPL